MPIVSVIISSYNHENYISETIQSILDQSFQDFEIIITDDASTDNTIEKIKRFKDSRIRMFCFPQNQGPSQVFNFSLAQAQGKYIAFLASDDIAMPERLEKQIKFLETHTEVGAVLSHAHLIDKEGNPLDHPIKHIFDKKNLSRSEWLNYFFYQGNCLCAPSAMVRKSVFEKIGDFHSCFLQLQDFDLWIRLCLYFEIHILEDSLIKYRIHPTNLSSNKIDNNARSEWEYTHILKHFFDLLSIDELLKIFPELKKYYTHFDKTLIPFYVAMLCFKTNSTPHHFAALEALQNLLLTSADLLKEKVNFSFPDFFKLVGKYDVFRYNIKLQYERMSNSRIWKITKPLRWLKNLI